MFKFYDNWLLILFTTVLFAACTPHDTTWQIDSHDIGNDFHTKITCEKAGHTWLEKVGRAQQPLCTKKFTDGGKQCISSNQCEGSCLNFKSHLTAAKEGVCQYYGTTFGCFHTIEASQKNEPMICID